VGPAPLYRALALRDDLRCTLAAQKRIYISSGWGGCLEQLVSAHHPSRMLERPNFPHFTMARRLGIMRDRSVFRRLL
jgi:hypothetical protein